MMSAANLKEHKQQGQVSAGYRDEQKDEDSSPSVRDYCTAVYRTVQGLNSHTVIHALVLVNFFLLYCRPQNQIPFLGTIRLPMVMSLVLAAAWLKNIRKMSWPVQVKIMLLFIAIGVIWTPIARNNFWAFHTTLDLGIQFFCYMFPLITFMSNGRGLRRLASLFTVVGIYLAVYAVTHLGKGPGGFTEDENDLCLVLIMLLSLPLALSIFEQHRFTKFAMIGSSLIILAGIVSTMSRGGFVGLMVMFSYLFLKMRAKLPAIVLMLFIGIAGLAFVPDAYWQEMSTISTEESTAQARLHMWDVALRIWFNFEHFLFGVGPQNTQWWIRDYESALAASDFGRSVAGRAVHSMYVQLIVDLGAVGMLLFLMMAYKSYRSNQATRAASDMLRIRVNNGYENVVELYEEEGMERLPLDDDSGGSQVKLSAEELSDLELLGRTLRGADSEALYIHAYAVALNAAWLGVLCSAVFISVFYYPPVWTLAALSAAIMLYRDRLAQALDPLLDRTDPGGAEPEAAQRPVRRLD